MHVRMTYKNRFLFVYLSITDYIILNNSKQITMFEHELKVKQEKKGKMKPTVLIEKSIYLSIN